MKKDGAITTERKVVELEKNINQNTETKEKFEHS